MNRDAGTGEGVNPMNVRVWVSTNSGETFEATGFTVASSSGSAYELDKPTIDVSWYSGTLGYVYVTYVEFGIGMTNGYNRILLRRSTNGVTRRCRPTGGGCIDPFDMAVVVHDGRSTLSTEFHQSAYTPAVAVNSDNGNVYVVFTTNTGIYISASRDQGVTFGESVRVSPVPPYAGLNYHLAGSVRAFTVPMPRYNPVTGRLMIVWHGGQAPGDSDVYYTDFDADAVTHPDPFYRQPMPEPVRYAEAGEQWQPALDSDDAGNALIAYYAAAGGYQAMGRYVQSGGGTIYGPAQINNAGFFYAHPSNLGDYHEVFYWGSRWRNSWIRRLTVNNFADFDLVVNGIR